MNWESFYLLCFLIGLGLSVVSFVLGSFDLHMPHLHFNGVDGGPHVHFHVGHVHAPAHAGGGGTGVGAEENLALHGAYGVSPINFSTLMAFLAWFGGAGYLMTHYSRVAGAVALLVSVLAGFCGAAVVFWFMAKVLYSPDEVMDPADYEMVGTLGRLTVSIRQGGTGEILYVQGGSRKTAAARSDTGAPVEKGIEVVVTRYEKGIAYVRRWEELAGEAAADSSSAEHN